MPLYTLIALLLSMFGATIALLGALRSHHGSTISTIAETYIQRCNEVRLAHLAKGEMENEVNAIQASLTKSLWWWGKMMVVPIWVFSFVVALLALAVLITPWENGTTATAPYDWVVLNHCLLCKISIGCLLALNIWCYGMAVVSQKKIRTDDKMIGTLKKSVGEQQAKAMNLNPPSPQQGTPPGAA